MENDLRQQLKKAEEEAKIIRNNRAAANKSIIAQGWECPKCGRVYAPNISVCQFCGNWDVTVTTGGGILTCTRE